MEILNFWSMPLHMYVYAVGMHAENILRGYVRDCVSRDLFTTMTFVQLTQPAVPGNSVRIEKSNFCDDGVASYMGYIEVIPKHFFFCFFRSRSNPETDGLTLWRDGGPAVPLQLAFSWSLMKIISATLTGIKDLFFLGE
ncbi:hypothetical protein ACEPAF_1170 [Sanghuangporus sanghuang]